MVTISPISIWSNGQLESATILSVICVNDNLINTATFYYQLMNVDQISITNGNLTMNLDAYQNWQTNQQAYEWVATQLNLTIVGEYQTIETN